MSFQDRLEKISATIQELHQAAGDGPRTRRLIDSLFRDVHSFKAAAAADGLPELSRIAHEFENLLHSVRTGKINLDGEVLRACDNAAGALCGEPESFSSANLHELTQQPPSAHTPVSDALASLKEEEQHRANAARREGATLYVMEVIFDPGDFDERFRVLKLELEKIAEIISTSALMHQGQIRFRILYAAKSEKVRVRKIFEQAASAGKALATELGKQIEFIVAGEELLLEKPVAEVLADALLHLVRNAVDHGIDSSGKVTLATQQTQKTLRLFVTDNGRGIDPANLPRLFEPGFSTAPEVSPVSGRGVGLDVVKTTIEALGGAVNVRSKPGEGTSFVISLPNPSSDA